MTKIERILVLNDFHIPFQDRKTLDNVYSCIKDMKPNKIYLLGDIIDFYSVSRFDKDPTRALTLEKELKKTQVELKKLRNTTDAEIIYVHGNHEERLRKYILRNAKELFWVKELKVENLLGLKELKIKYVNKRWTNYKGTLYSHMNRASGYGGYTAKNIGQRIFKDVIHGHSHKTGKVRMNQFTFIDNGCLCELNAEYLECPSDWTQAFTVVTHKDGKKYIEQVDIIDHKFIYGGKMYG